MQSSRVESVYINKSKIYKLPKPTLQGHNIYIFSFRLKKAWIISYSEGSNIVFHKDNSNIYSLKNEKHVHISRSYINKYTGDSNENMFVKFLYT